MDEQAIRIEMLAAVTAFLDVQGWSYETTEADPPTLRTSFEGLHGRWICYARIYADAETFVFYSVFPIDAPDARRPAMMECLTRANAGMMVGNFEIDLADGEILYKTSLGVTGTHLTPTLVENIVYPNLGAVDRYFTALLDVLYERATPAAAVARADAPPDIQAGT